MSALLLDRWVQLAAGMAMALALGFGLGHRQKTLEDAAAALKQARAAPQAVARQEVATSRVGLTAAKAQQAARTTANVNLQRVPIYVTRQADDQCVIGVGAVRLLDASARNVPAVPLGPGESADAPSAVALSDVVAADLVNAGEYHQLAEQVNGWIAWYDEQRALAAGR